MSRRKVLGRASLSFPAADGILDVDQILQTDPWKQINDFVQQNFTQNILNEFNERLMLEPKLTPVDDTSPGKRRATSSRRSPRKSGASRTNEEKSPTKKEDEEETVGADGKLNENGKKIAKKSGKARLSTSSTVEKEQLKDVPKVNVERSRATMPKKRSENGKHEEKEKIVDEPTETKQQRETKNTDPTNDRMENIRKDASAISANTSKSTDSKSPFRTSTPRRSKVTKQGNSTGNEVAAAAAAAATTERNISSFKRDCFLRRNASTNNYRARDAYVTKDLNNNNTVANNTVANNTVANNTEHKRTEKGTREKKRRSNETSDVSTKTTSRCKKHDKKMATTAETKQIGKEKQLLKQRRRRYKGKIRRIEKKVDRAMETYIHHVTRIVKKIGYLPEDSSCSENDDSYSDFSNESSCCGSYCSDSCCSYCSDSCCSSCDYSEYTLHSPSSSSPCSSTSSSSSASSFSPSSSPLSSCACGPLSRSKAK